MQALTFIHGIYRVPISKTLAKAIEALAVLNAAPAKDKGMGRTLTTALMARGARRLLAPEIAVVMEVRFQ